MLLCYPTVYIGQEHDSAFLQWLLVARSGFIGQEKVLYVLSAKTMFPSDCDEMPMRRLHTKVHVITKPHAHVNLFNPYTHMHVECTYVVECKHDDTHATSATPNCSRRLKVFSLKSFPLYISGVM